MLYIFRPLAKFRPKKRCQGIELEIGVSVEGKNPTTSTTQQYQIDSYFRMGWKLDLV